MGEKNLYIISGPNGAGKTTASYTVLPKILHCKEFVNADEIARGLSPLNPSGMAIEAGKLIQKSKNMSTKEHKEMIDKIVQGLKIAEREMLEEKARNNEDIVVCGADNIIRHVPAKNYL